MQAHQGNAMCVDVPKFETGRILCRKLQSILTSDVRLFNVFNPSELLSLGRLVFGKLV